KTRGVAAHGHGGLSEPEATVGGDAAHLNLDDEVGGVDAADADMHRREYRLRCNRLVKRGGPLYSVSDGIFTTCGCGGLEKPSWGVKGGGGGRRGAGGRGGGGAALPGGGGAAVFPSPFFVPPPTTPPTARPPPPLRTPTPRVSS